MATLPLVTPTDGRGAGADVAIARARELATAQCTDGEVAAMMVVEQGWTLSQAQQWVAERSDDLLTCRWAGRAIVRQRTYLLATGEDVGKVNGYHMNALATFGEAYLGLGERAKITKMVEQAERAMAKGGKLKAVG